MSSGSSLTKAMLTVVCHLKVSLSCIVSSAFRVLTGLMANAPQMRYGGGDGDDVQFTHPVYESCNRISFIFE